MGVEVWVEGVVKVGVEVWGVGVGCLFLRLASRSDSHSGSFTETHSSV